MQFPTPPSALPGRQVWMGQRLCYLRMMPSWQQFADCVWFTHGLSGFCRTPNHQTQDSGAELRIPDPKLRIPPLWVNTCFEFTVHRRKRCMNYMIMQPLTTKWHSVDSQYSFNALRKRSSVWNHVHIQVHGIPSCLRYRYFLGAYLLCCRKTSDLPWTALMKIFDQKIFWIYNYIYIYLIIYNNIMMIQYLPIYDNMWQYMTIYYNIW